MLLKCGILHPISAGDTDEPAYNMQEDISAFEQYTYVWDLNRLFIAQTVYPQPFRLFRTGDERPRPGKSWQGPSGMRKLLVGVYDDFKGSVGKNREFPGEYTSCLIQYGEPTNICRPSATSCWKKGWSWTPKTCGFPGTA